VARGLPHASALALPNPDPCGRIFLMSALAHGAWPKRKTHVKCPHVMDLT